MKFDRYPFDKSIKLSLAEQGFNRPTDIQYKSIPPILSGEDVMAIAQTGTGKTGAFVIPILQLLQERIDRDEERAISCIVMVPTRELAMQIHRVFLDFGKHTQVKIACVTGGVDQEPQILKLARGCDVLVATPGRMFDLIYQKYIKITKVKILVLDEADQMLDMGFIKDIQDVKKFLPKVHQTLFFSATINTYIKDLAYSLVKNPIRIQISPKERISRNIEHSVAKIAMDDKRFFLERIFKEHPDDRTLVFVRTQVRAERVSKAMARINIETLTMHGGKDQDERIDVLSQFREGIVKFLIATDVSARGIDIPNVKYVINYDIPDQVENYVHRVGRTGRGNEKGFAVSFCSPEEEDLLADIENFIEIPINIASISKGSYAQTLEFTEDTNYDWRSLIENQVPLKPKKKRKKK